MSRNRQVCFARVPEGAVTESCFALRDGPVPDPGPGQVLVRNLYLSCDPYMRGRMAGGPGYAAGFELDQPIPARAVAQVAVSHHPDFQAGDFVWDFLRWEEYTLVTNVATLRHIDPTLGPVSHAISVLGMPGLTAEVGMLEIGRPQPGETVFVSAASGAVGQIAGQLARCAGARVVGSAGSDAKVDHIVRRLGFDAGFNYRTVDSLDAALLEHCPEGIDVYFDNVGGATLDAVLPRLKPFARVPVCGMISQYDGFGPGVRRLTSMVAARATMTGFIVSDHMHGFDAFVPRMAARLQRGELVYYEDIVDGIDNAPAAFVGMMRGENLGKRLIRVADGSFAASV